MPQISIIVPLYNEADAFSELIERLTNVIDDFPGSVEVILIDDGSNDGTTQQVTALALADRSYQAVVLSRNFGHQVALSAGLKYARASEAVFIIDGDLQDPPELLETFYAKFKLGYDVVYGIRRNRKESNLKRLSYFLYYRMQKLISSSDTAIDSGDFSLISRRVVDILNSMPEDNRYLRGLRTWVGFEQIGIKYDRQRRTRGASKYSWRKLMGLASEGIFNFSKVPLKIITWTGIIAILVSTGYLAHTLFKKYILHDTPEGFTGLLFTIILLGGVQLVSIGIVGEYIYRIFSQVKQRPAFLVRERIVDRQIEEADDLEAVEKYITRS